MEFIHLTLQFYIYFQLKSAISRLTLGNSKIQSQNVNIGNKIVMFIYYGKIFYVHCPIRNELIEIIFVQKLLDR